MEEKDLQKLLKLKRYENPGEEYFENFLSDFHQRQREDMLKVPAWKLAVERVNGFFQQFEVPRYAYASALGMFLMLTVFLNLNSSQVGNQLAAQSGSTNAVAEVGTDSVGPLRLGQESMIAQSSLDRQFEEGLSTASASVKSVPTRYVLDSRPVSYDSPFSF